MRDLELRELKEIVNESNTALLCGNGFSMNFDSGYKNIFNRFYVSHKGVLRYGKIKMIGGTAFQKAIKSNYEDFKSYIYSFSKKRYYEIFDEALVFAISISSNDRLRNYLIDEGKLNNLTFGINQLDLVDAICRTSDKYGVGNVNIEHWTILFYFYYLLNDIDADIYYFPRNNLFITLIKAGGAHSYLLKEYTNEYGEALINGFAVYYRFLISLTVLNEGKSVSGKDLDNMDNLNLANIKEAY